MVLTLENYLDTRQSPRTGWIPTGKLAESERKRIRVRQDTEHFVAVLYAHVRQEQIDPSKVRFQLSSGQWYSVPEFLESQHWRKLADNSWYDTESPLSPLIGQPSTMLALKKQLPATCEEILSEVTHVEFLP
jgi:hypothetical protein